MNNIYTKYDEFVNEEASIGSDDDFALDLIEYIKKNCDEIEIEKSGHPTQYKFKIKSDVKNEDDPLGEENWGGEVDVLIIHHTGLWKDELLVNGQLLDISKRVGRSLSGAIKDIELLKLNKKKRSYIDQARGLMGKEKKEL